MFLNKLKKVKEVFLILFLSACAQDIGIYKEITEEIVIEGDMVVQTYIAYDQALDIMFFIDKSCSMDDEEKQLGLTMPLIYNKLIGPEFNSLKWRIGVKSTDPTQGEVTKWVDWDDSNIQLKLSTLHIIDNSWSLSHESGLDAAIFSMAWDTQFHREDAILLNVFISDEEDQSNYSTADYNSLSYMARQYPFEVVDSIIVNTGTTEGCNDTIGYRYMEIAETIIDICDYSKWDTVLNSAKDKVLKLNKLYELNQTPISTDTIEVYIDDQLMVEDRDWTYRDDQNTVELFVVPEDGAPVVIAYLI